MQPGAAPAEHAIPGRWWPRRTRLAVAITVITIIAVTGATAAVATANSGGGTSTNIAAVTKAPASPSQTSPTPTPTAQVDDVIVPAPEPSPSYDPSTKPCPHTASACVDIEAKVAWLQDDDAVTRGPVPISIGMPGHETPTGTFHVAWKAVYTKSTIYDIPMPYSVFFAAGGIAFHEGPLDEASHGCVHLDRGDAEAFFDALKVGDEVVVW
jgi:lipoprotein-anchoring transpeptidase ErfK/SrfK